MEFTYSYSYCFIFLVFKLLWIMTWFHSGLFGNSYCNTYIHLSSFIYIYMIYVFIYWCMYINVSRFILKNCRKISSWYLTIYVYFYIFWICFVHYSQAKLKSLLLQWILAFYWKYMEWMSDKCFSNYDIDNENSKICWYQLEVCNDHPTYYLSYMKCLYIINVYGFFCFTKAYFFYLCDSTTI